MNLKNCFRRGDFVTLMNMKKKPEITYPCKWSYKVIATDRKYIAKTVPELLESREYEFAESRQSTTGKYTSFSLSLRVNSEAERNKIFNILKYLPSVKMVL